MYVREYAVFGNFSPAESIDEPSIASTSHSSADMITAGAKANVN